MQTDRNAGPALREYEGERPFSWEWRHPEGQVYLVQIAPQLGRVTMAPEPHPEPPTVPFMHFHLPGGTPVCSVEMTEAEEVGELTAEVVLAVFERAPTRW